MIDARFPCSENTDVFTCDHLNRHHLSHHHHETLPWNRTQPYGGNSSVAVQSNRVSPCKKRVRIIDSPSVRVIDDKPHLAKIHVPQLTWDLSTTVNDPNCITDMDNCVSGISVQNSSAFAFLNSIDNNSVSTEDTCGIMMDLEINELTCIDRHCESNDFLSNGNRSLKHLCSLESRDNPFLPDGDLSKETEELLSQAIIVRNKFYLGQQGHAEDIENLPELEKLHNNNENIVREEKISFATNHKTEDVKSNGRTSKGIPSEDRVELKVKISTPTCAKSSRNVIDGSNGDDHCKDIEHSKERKRQKCCAIM